MSLLGSNSLVSFILRHPEKVFYLDAVTPYRNTKGQWKCLVRDKWGRKMWKWCELPELDNMVESVYNTAIDAERTPMTEGKGKGLWRGI